MRYRFGWVLVMGGLAIGLSGAPAGARGIGDPTGFDRRATLSADGSTVTVTGFVDCAVGPQVHLEITVAEGPVSATGAWDGVCSGAGSPFTATLAAGDVTTGRARAFARATGADGTRSWGRGNIDVVTG